MTSEGVTVRSGEGRTVFLVVPTGYSARYLLRTDIFRTLKEEGVRIVILAPNADEEYFRKEFEDLDVFVERLEIDRCTAYYAESLVRRQFVRLRADTLSGRGDLLTLDDKNRDLRRVIWSEHRVLGLLLRAAVWALRRSRLLRRALVALESRLFVGNFHAPLFARYRPDLVVTTSVGYFWTDFILMREAKRHGARTLSIVLSWDNPSSKGLGGAHPDRVVAWTEVMKQELETYLDFRPDQIFVGGVAHWDAYHRDEAPADRADLFRRMGLDAQRRTIVFGAKSPRPYPNHDIVQIVGQAIADDRLGVPCQLLVRLHPGYFEPGVEEALETMMGLEGRYPHVIFNVPQVLSRRLALDMPESEMDDLVGILRHADVLVNLFSTLAIEAAICDLPIVNVCFDGPSFEREHGLARARVPLDPYRRPAGPQPPRGGDGRRRPGARPGGSDRSDPRLPAGPQSRPRRSPPHRGAGGGAESGARRGRHRPIRPGRHGAERMTGERPRTGSRPEAGAGHSIVLSVANGFAARFLLRSGVLDRLLDEGHRVVVASPNGDESYLKAELERPNVALRALSLHPTRLADNFERRIWNVLAPSRADADATVLDTIDRLKPSRPRTHRFLSRLNGAVSGRPSAVAALRTVDRILSPGRGARPIFDEFRPDLVVVTSSGYETNSVALLREAHRRGVRTLNAVLSWDNLSTRGPMRERADRLAVWSELSRTEAVQIHGYPREHVAVTGAPHFDVYARSEGFAPWQEYCARTGLDPERLLITLGGTTPDITDGFDDIVRLLARSIDEDRFVEPCQLLVRPHPIVLSGWTKGQGMREHFDAYRAMGRHVHCDAPAVRSRVLMADLPPEDSRHLAETLHHSAVLVNFFSTLMIDAGAAGCPIISVAFDGSRQRDYNHSVRRIEHIRCIRDVLSTGAVRVARTPEDLIDLVNRYLKDRALEAEERRQLVEKICHRVDGRSAERLARVISRWAQGRWAPGAVEPSPETIAV